MSVQQAKSRGADGENHIVCPQSFGREFEEVMRRVEMVCKEMQDVVCTIYNDKLYILDACSAGRRTKEQPGSPWTFGRTMW